MDFTLLKHLHMTAVGLSGALFLLRGIWMLQESPRLAYKWVRVVPHVIDTVLLLSAIGMCVVGGFYPFVSGMGWLDAKVTGLIAYIVLGTMALKRGRTKQARTVYFVLALAVFAYIVMVAVSKSPVLGLV